MGKILLIGKTGQVGWELERTLCNLGSLVSVGRNTMDLTNPDSIQSVIQNIKPEIIVNAAAYTAVDKAEDENDIARKVNGVAPGIIAEEAKRYNATLIHYSTDYVFDGNKTTPYSEYDTPNPRSVYGITKLEGEKAIESAGIPHLILRTSWVYGTRGKNFLLTIQRLARERDTLSIVDDQKGSPTWSRLIAEATSQILVHLRNNSINDLNGIYHLTCSNETSWYGFAKKILDYTYNGKNNISLHPIPSEQYPTPAARPMYSVLDNNKLNQNFGIKLPDWDTALKLAFGN